jgi:hypothetical protein
MNEARRGECLRTPAKGRRHAHASPARRKEPMGGAVATVTPGLWSGLRGAKRLQGRANGELGPRTEEAHVELLEEILPPE